MAGEMEKLPALNITDVVGVDATGVGGLMDLTEFANLVINAYLASLPTSAPTAAKGPWLNGETGFVCFSKQSDFT